MMFQKSFVIFIIELGVNGSYEHVPILGTMDDHFLAVLGDYEK